MVIIPPVETRVERQSRAENSDGNLCSGGGSDHFRFGSNAIVAGSFTDRLGRAAHQGWSCNLFTLSSDMFPGQAVASVVGLGGFAGAVGGMLIADAVGHILQWTHSYVLPFLIAGSAYVMALFILHLLAPKLAPVHVANGGN